MLCLAHYDDFSDFESLSISDEEKRLLIHLNSLSIEYGVEHATAIADGELMNNFPGGQYNKIQIPEAVLMSGSVRLFHSHTNRTPLSQSDLALLSVKGIFEINVITIDRSVFRVIRDPSHIITESEYYETVEGLDEEVNFDILIRPGFSEWDFELRNYMAIKEQMFRTARLFKWRLEGGRV